MLDKNGVEIKTGQVVEITGAYFKRDNGLYFVIHSPGDPGWYSPDYSLMRILKSGKISMAKNNLGVWPIRFFAGIWDKAGASIWNAGQIEVKSIKNMTEIAAYFQAMADETKESNRRTATVEEIQNFYRAIAANCKNADCRKMI